jgi:magnesium transporter
MTEASTGPLVEVAELSPELLQLLAGDVEDLNAVCAAHQPGDVAVALRRLPPATAAVVIDALPFEYAVQVVDKPELEDHRSAIFDQLGLERAAALVEEMSSDQQAAVFRALSASRQEPLLARLSATTQDSVRLLLRYPPRSAGGIMTTELASVGPSLSAGEALAYIRQVAATRETVYAVYLVDPDTERLIGVVSLRELLIADPDRPVRLATRAGTLVTVDPLTDREEVARLIRRHNLLAVPVVDRSRRLLGIVTVDDVIDTLVKEQTEDIQKLSGVEAFDTPYTEISFGQMIRKRGGWLAVLFLGETLTATAMGTFEHEISRAVVLSLFIPLIISSGGNSGGQATSLIIRALALRQLKVGDWWRVALRELPAGLTLGAILGVIGAGRVLLWQLFGWYDYGVHFALVALTVGCSLIGVVTFGSLAGSMLPFILRRLGFDPASASAPFVATMVDVTGLVIYFSVAVLVLRGTLL